MASYPVFLGVFTSTDPVLAGNEPLLYLKQRSQEGSVLAAENVTTQVWVDLWVGNLALYNRAMNNNGVYIQLTSLQ